MNQRGESLAEWRVRWILRRVDAALQDVRKYGLPAGTPAPLNRLAGTEQIADYVAAVLTSREAVRSAHRPGADGPLIWPNELTNVREAVIEARTARPSRERTTDLIDETLVLLAHRLGVGSGRNEILRVVRSTRERGMVTGAHGSLKKSLGPAQVSGDGASNG